MIGTHHRFLRATVLLSALVAALQTGGVIDTSSGAEADAANEDSDLGGAADGASSTDPQPSPDLGVAFSAAAPLPDAEVDAEDLGPPDPMVDPADCGAICRFRAEGLPGWGSCQLESFRPPGVSSDCVKTCERAQA